MLFDERDLYFATKQEGPYQQGDLVLAPNGVFDQHVSSESDLEPAKIGAEIRRQLWRSGPLAPISDSVDIPAADLVGVFCPAMIITHDCTLEKEFNRAFERLRREGLGRQAATDAANGDPTLDRLFHVAPLVPLTKAAPATAESLVSNSVLGYFPVCAWADRAVDDGVIDFGRVSTVDRDVVVGRLASISVDARRALMFAIARYWVFRAPHVGLELEAAVRQRITHVEISAQDPLIVDVELADGSILQLIEPPEPPSPGGLERAAVS